MAGKKAEVSNATEGTGSVKLNSRVTAKHVEVLKDGLIFAMGDDANPAVRLGYLKFAVASVLKDIGMPQYHTEISKQMYAAMGIVETRKGE